MICFRTERGRSFRGLCGSVSNTMSPDIKKMTCKQCEKAYNFIGPIHPRLGHHRPWDTKEVALWSERYYDRPKYDIRKVAGVMGLAALFM